VIGNRRIVVAVLAVSLALAGGLALLPAKAGMANMESCWVIYSRMIGGAEGDRQVVDPRNPEASQAPEGPHHGGNISHDAWIEAGDFLLDCITQKLSGLFGGTVRFLHVPGNGMPHASTFVVNVPPETGRARLWLFTAPLEGTAGGIVPRVTVNGRIAWEGTEPTATGPLATVMPLLPGDNEIAVGCDPADPVAAVLVLELLEE